MKVSRRVEFKTESYAVGDVIKIKLKDGHKTTATCHKVYDDKALFVFDKVVALEPMNEKNTTEGGWKECYMREWLHDVFYDILPKKIKKRIVRENGDLLRLLDYTEVFGKDDIPGWIEPENVTEQLPLMKDRRYRIGADMAEDYCSYWLRDVASAASFAFVNYNGNAHNYGASNSVGVRPAFVIHNLKSPSFMDGLYEEGDYPWE